ncbi:uncharacterized protein LOC110154848 isoform X2 [Boleophthalmus pectinirostris]|uniref:uncharacterized protein LOC110154848 isoform X2 n=1 Tax=Boleophthalmus pectinirostris TaxID=150288 RepID=UPI0024324DBF|nr:uncharacterized protein LOC110154848 isoform X2 [Boleophthalmus pectinirostris]
MGAVAGLLFMVSFCWMTLYAAFWWDSFMWSLVFCFLHVQLLVKMNFKFKRYSDYFGPSFFLCLGQICSFLGVFLFLLPGIGNDLFRVFFNIGAICALGSILFLFLEKTFDEAVHGACSAIFDTLRHNETLQEILSTVLVGFFVGLICYLSPPPRCQSSQIYASDCELKRKQTEKQQKEMAKRLDKVKNAGTALTICMVIGNVLWETGMLFWIVHEYYSDVILFTGVFILGAGSSFVGIWLRNFTAFGLTPFVVGNMFLVISTLSLKGPSGQLDKMFDNTRGTSATWMIIGFVLTQTTVFWVLLVLCPPRKVCSREGTILCSVEMGCYPIKISNFAFIC